VDINAHRVAQVDNEVGKLGDLERYAKSDVYSKREKLALELAERMTYTSKRVTARFFARLQTEFSDEELVELSAAIAYENFRSKFSTVFAVESNGLCSLPSVREKTEELANRSLRH